MTTLCGDPDSGCQCTSGCPAAVVLKGSTLDAQLEWLRGTRIPLASVTARDTDSPEQQPCCVAIDLLIAGSALQVRSTFACF